MPSDKPVRVPSDAQVRRFCGRLQDMLLRDVMPGLRDGTLSLADIEPSVSLTVGDQSGVGADLEFILSVRLAEDDDRAVPHMLPAPEMLQ